MTNTAEPTRTGWDESEALVRKKSAASNDREFKLAIDLINHLVAGLANLNDRPTKNASEEVVYAISLAATNSMYVSIKLAVSGWYNQAMSLIRDVFELGMAGSYALYNPDKAEGLKQAKTEWPRPKTLRRELARVSADDETSRRALLDQADAIYRFLCKFPHPSFISVSSVFEEDEKTRLGPFYRTNAILHCMDHLYRMITFFTSLLAETFPDRLWDTDWNSERTRLQQRVSGWVAAVWDEYEKSQNEVKA